MFLRLEIKISINSEGITRFIRIDGLSFFFNNPGQGIGKGLDLAVVLWHGANTKAQRWWTLIDHMHPALFHQAMLTGFKSISSE